MLAANGNSVEDSSSRNSSLLSLKEKFSYRCHLSLSIFVIALQDDGGHQYSLSR